VDNYRPALTKAGHVDHMSTSPGPLARKANVTHEGFSMARWLFWRQRLGELFLSGGEQVAQPAREGFEVIVRTGLGAGIKSQERKIISESCSRLLIENSSLETPKEVLTLRTSRLTRGGKMRQMVRDISSENIQIILLDLSDPVILRFQRLHEACFGQHRGRRRVMLEYKTARGIPRG
jgi:hypothetical protein